MKLLLPRVLPVICLFVLFQSCSKNDTLVTLQPDATSVSAAVATEWMNLYRDIVTSEGKNPPQASRIYAYGGISLYQSVLPSMQEYRSLEGQVDGFTGFPRKEQFGKMDPIASANEAMYQVGVKIFGSLKAENKQKIEDLHNKYFDQRIKSVLAEEVQNATDYGKMVAIAVVNRANTDNFATTRSMSYTAPSPLLNPANWMPTGAATNPLEPYWGKVKCFAMATSAACTIPSSVPFSTVPGSGFHNMATEVYNTVKNLTTEQRNIALWWADDAGATSTPPGHWVSIIGQVVNTKNIGLGKASEAYALVTMSMADAFISCWDAKYQYNLLRPVSYIKQHIAGGNTWSTVLNTPPFPEYPSGHSVASGAAADVLTALFGNIAFTDQTGASLGYASRSYTSFHHAAQEAALSRLYGGIHYREAIDNGLVQGKEVAKAVFNKIKMK